jgi:asparagine synthase (glutamine-hydrolysing)
MGHNLLSIIGYQPQPIEGKRYKMVFNGVWYDYKDYFAGVDSDTLALLYSVETDGIEQTIKNCNGMFAIALYDTILKKLHLIVDRFAQKPIYYFHDGDKFAFASTPAALLQFKDKWEIDKDALQSYWLLGSTMGSDSLWKGIHKVCASEWVTLDLQSNELTTKRYWEPQFQENTNDIEELVLDAIQKVKISDVPVHIFLSGGIDSTVVASQCHGMDAVHLDSNEKQYAKLVSERFGIRLKHVYPQEINVEESLNDYAFQCGEPSGAALIPYITAKETAKFGKVAIIANGADEIAFGYNRTSDEPTYEQRNHLFRGSLFGVDNPAIPIGRLWLDERFKMGRWNELFFFVQYDLNKTLDFASGCHGLEVRSPFLDHRLVEMALSIPEKKHREHGNKTILKGILRKFGFNDQFLNRSKQGFSLEKKPYGIEDLIKLAVGWCLKEGWLTLPSTFDKLSGRDQRYTEMACLSFYYFHQTWKHKII